MSKLVTNSGSGWSQVSCARISAPPLRFSGREIDRRPSGIADIDLILYERKQGGFTIAVPTVQDGEWRADSLRAGSWEKLFDVIEDHFARLARHQIDGGSLQDLLARHAAFAARRDQVLDKVGEALDLWHLLAVAEAAQV